MATESDALTAAREKVLDWGPDHRQPERAARFARDVRELERLAGQYTTGIDVAFPGSSMIIIGRDPDGRVWSPEEVGEALGAVAKAAGRWESSYPIGDGQPHPIRPLPVPGHRGLLQSNGPDDPWTCTECGWAEGDEPREHHRA